MSDSDRQVIFEWPIRVYIEDTDAGGIVFYVNYLKFIERARTEYLRGLGFDKQFIFNTDLMFVVKAANCEYQKPAQLDDELIATVNVIKVGRALLMLEQKVFRQTTENKELLFHAEVKLACVNRQTMKPTRMPAEMLAVLSQKCETIV